MYYQLLDVGNIRKQIYFTVFVYVTTVANFKQRIQKHYYNE